MRLCSLISDFVIRSLDSIIFKLAIYKRNFNILTSLYSLAGWFGYDLVGNTEDMFSREERPIYEPIREILEFSASANSQGSESSSLHTHTVLWESFAAIIHKEYKRKAQTKNVISIPTRYLCMQV